MFSVVKLKSLLRRFYDRHRDLVNRYGVSRSQITTNMFRLSSSQDGPFLIHGLFPLRKKGCSKTADTLLKISANMNYAAFGMTMRLPII